MQELLIRLLRDAGYDGLCYVDGNEACGCKLDDFAPCGGDNIGDCEPGYKAPCECGDGCDFHITPNRTEKINYERLRGKLCTYGKIDFHKCQYVKVEITKQGSCCPKEKEPKC